MRKLDGQEGWKKWNWREKKRWKVDDEGILIESV